MTARERLGFTLRTIVSYVLYYAGVLHLLQRIVLRHKAVVLMYHRVLTPDQRRQTASQAGLVVEDGTFARQLDLLKRRFAVLTLDQFEERLARRQPFDKPCCLITFDDGWVDNFNNALPVLRAYGLPAVIFLPVNFIGRRRLFTREALTHLLVRAVKVSRLEPSRRGPLGAHLATLGLERVLEIADEDPLDAVRAALQAHRYANGPAFEALVSALSAELGVRETELSELDTFIDWTQVDRMSQQGVTFGGHGAEHHVLTQVSTDVVQSEVASSKDVLDTRLTTPVRAFAYPGGGWNADIAETVKTSGYRLAFTIEPGPVSCDDNPFALRRVNIHEGMTGSTPMFMARLTGLF